MKYLLPMLLILTAYCGTKVYKNEIDFSRDLARQGLWKEAAFRLEKELRRNEGAGVLNDLAICYEALGDFDKAGVYYRRALEIAPNDSYIKDNYQRFLNRTKNNENENEDEKK